MTSPRRLLGGLLLSWTWLAPLPATADDASEGVLLPPLRSAPAGSVRLDEVRLVLARGAASLTLSVRTRPTAPALTVDFARFGWLGGGDTYPDRQFPELDVSVDGQKASTVDSVRSFFGSRELTSPLAALRFDPWAIVDTPPFVTVNAVEDPRVQALLALHALEPAESRQFFARWQSQRHLAIPLAADTTTEVVLRWKPRPALALMSWGSPALRARLRSHCAGPSTLGALVTRPAPGEPVRVAEYVVHLTLDGRVARTSHFDLDPASFSGRLTLACRTASPREARVLTIERLGVDTVPPPPR